MTRHIISRVAEEFMGSRFFLCTLLLFVTGIVYAQVRHYESVIVDDPLYFSQNTRVRQGLNLDGIAWSATSVHDGNWLPITWFSLMLDAELYGDWPGGYHITNVVLHALNSVLLFVFLAQCTHATFLSAFVAAAFAIHPQHVESVAWIAERKDVLSTAFGLGAMLGYVGYARSGRAGSYWLAVVLYAGSLLSKPTLVTLPFVFLLLDVWPLRRLPELAMRMAHTWNSIAGGSPSPTKVDVGPWGNPAAWCAAIREKTPFFILPIIFCPIVLLAQSRVDAINSFDRIPLLCRLFNAAIVYVKYTQMALFPHDLAVYYPHPGTALKFADAAFPVMLLVAATAGALVVAHRWPFVLVGWLWYLGTLVPMIGLVQVGGQQMADRYMYFPSIGLFVVAVWSIAEIAPSAGWGRRAFALLGLVHLSIFGVGAHVQAGYWQDSITLFRRAVEVTENNPFARGALGTALVRSGAFEEGIGYLRQALQMAPRDARARVNLASGLQAAGQVDEAENEYLAALAIDPRCAAAHNNLAVLLSDCDCLDEARSHLLEAIRIEPLNTDAMINLGVLSAQQDKLGEAVARFEAALSLDPKNPLTHHNLGLALCRRKQFDAAIAHFQFVLDKIPDNWHTRLELARTMALKGDIEQARLEIDVARRHASELPAAASLLADVTRQVRQVVDNQ